jgi:hypothetical protein
MCFKNYKLKMGNYLSTNTKEQLEQGINPNEIIQGNYPILFNFSNKRELETLIENGADINLVYNGKTALTRAALKDNFYQVRMLLLYNAYPNPLIKVGENTVPWNTTNPVLSTEMTTLLEIYGYPQGSNTNTLTQEINDKMFENIQETLKTMPTTMHYPCGYSSFMREDDRLVVDDILNHARMYDHISRNLDYNHVALWMVKNNFVFVSEDVE